jgi:hypothetical protein
MYGRFFMQVETINQIYEFAEKHNMDRLRLENMGFYIGYKAYTPKSYGIYRDEPTGEFVVYKNKADGTHVEHYRGFDEAYAVRCIMDKLNDAISYNKRKAYSNGSGGSRKRVRRLSLTVIIISICFILGIFMFVLGNRHKNGYYLDDDGDVYYLLQNTMYGFDYYDDTWYVLSDYYMDDYEYYGNDYYFDDPAYDFSNTYYYEDYVESSNNYDDDSYDYDYDDDWDSDWDSGWDDWDSDW